MKYLIMPGLPILLLVLAHHEGRIALIAQLTIIGILSFGCAFVLLYPVVKFIHQLIYHHHE